MDFSDSPEERAYREKVHAWLSANASPAVAEQDLSVVADADNVPRAKEWQARKWAAGYAALTIAKEYGGGGEAPIKQVIYEQEEAKFDVARGTLDIGLGICIPTVVVWGSDAQRDRYVKKALSGEEVWCQLFSEPSGGSDLAALRTRAVRDGERWIVNGQKVWTSGAHFADYGLLLARTDPAAPKHKGITAFIVNMKAAGVEVRPIRTMAGSAEFNEVFFSDVSIPDSDRLGPPGQGWQVGLSTLMHERMKAGKGFGLAGWKKMLDIARNARIDGAPALKDSRVRERIADNWAQEEALRLLSFRAQTALSQGGIPGPEQSISKLVDGTLAQQAAAFMLDLVGEPAVYAAGSDSPLRSVYSSWMWAAATRIAGGSDEILRNVIAERVLGLPTDARPDKNTPFNEL